MPTTSTGLKYRVRYASPRAGAYKDLFAPRHRKNCLVTIQKEEYVFFGIARCKLSVDNFSKKEGRELALRRAIGFLDVCGLKTDSSLSGLASFYLDPKGEMGYCSVKYVKTLLKHFEGLDTKDNYYGR